MEQPPRRGIVVEYWSALYGDRTVRGMNTLHGANMLCTVCAPAPPAPRMEYRLKEQHWTAVIHRSHTLAVCVMLASASPRKPNVDMLRRSPNSLSLEVVNRSHTIGRSSLPTKTHAAARGAHTYIPGGRRAVFMPYVCI